MQTSRIRFAIIGSGGDGVMSTATMVLRAAAEQGFYGMMTQSYGPQIRGGEAAAFMIISDSPVYTENLEKDLIVCFRASDAERFRAEFTRAPGSVLIVEAAEKEPIPGWLKAESDTVIPIPFRELLEEAGLPEIAKNVLLFGVLSRTLGWDFQKVSQYVSDQFSYKGVKTVETNIKALQIGYEKVGKLGLPFECKFTRGRKALRSITGNIAIAEAATAAGCRFFAGYPITPASEILERLLETFPTVGGKVIQAEDEIASIGMVVGASYGGVPSMTATSGPGLSLMTEILGLASKAELPAVVVNCQRGGPSTGLPSRTEQSDLFHSIYGGHGDFPRVVMAPTDVSDCWPIIYRAFGVAEKYQIPVIVLSDAYIAHRSENILPVDTSSWNRPQRAKLTEIPSGGFRRFDCNSQGLPSGVSYFVEPGTPDGGHYIAGIEQTETGLASSNREIHVKMSSKRFSKLTPIADETANMYEILGDPAAEVGLVGWGSTKGALLELMESQKNFKLFIPRILHPFPTEAFKEFLKNVQRLIFVELNFQGQLFQHVRAIGTELPKNTALLALGGGRPISSRELAKHLMEIQ